MVSALGTGSLYLVNRRFAVNSKYLAILNRCALRADNWRCGTLAVLLRILLFTSHSLQHDLASI
jgi:hypothetical protein